MNRRKFLKFAAGIVAVPAAGVSYGFWEASALRVTRQTVALPNLPACFAGKSIALITDLHHGPYNGLDFIRSVVRATNELRPDLVALSGDFIDHGVEWFRPCFDALTELRAPLGVFAVPGNHDMWDGGRHVRRAIRDARIIDVTNSGRWIEASAGRLWVGGVDDLWWGKPDLAAALSGVSPSDATVLLCHNPDFVETIRDNRVGLVLSGHLHGGQIRLPVVGSPWLPSHYGDKYLHGLVRGPCTQVFVSRGVGCVALPMRVGSRPEINLLTLQPAPAAV